MEPDVSRYGYPSVKDSSRNRHSLSRSGNSRYNIHAERSQGSLRENGFRIKSSGPSVMGAVSQRRFESNSKEVPRITKYTDSYRGKMSLPCVDSFVDSRRAQTNGDQDSKRRKIIVPLQNRIDRDKRTILISHLVQKVTESDLNVFFAGIGNVTNTQVVRDRQSQKSKGIAFVEFKSTSAVELALKHTGDTIYDVPIVIEHYDTQDTIQAYHANLRLEKLTKNDSYKIYFGNIPFSIGESEIEELFSPCGQIAEIFLSKRTSGKSQGFGFVRYIQSRSGKTAMKELNGHYLIDRNIRLGFSIEKVTSLGAKHELTAAQNVMNETECDGSMKAANENVNFPTVPVQIPAPIVFPGFAVFASADDQKAINDIAEVLKVQFSKSGDMLHFDIQDDFGYVKYADSRSVHTLISKCNEKFVEGQLLMVDEFGKSDYYERFPEAESI